MKQAHTRIKEREETMNDTCKKVQCMTNRHERFDKSKSEALSYLPLFLQRWNITCATRTAFSGLLGKSLIAATIAVCVCNTAIAGSSGALSGFASPEPSDIQFVTTIGGDLHKEGHAGETLTIPLRIDRVFGDVGKLSRVQNGGIPDHVVLKMIVNDVDSDYEGSDRPPEVDRVCVNNYEVGYLSGHTDVWTYNEFLVPIDKLNLKKDETGSGYNTIEIHVAVDGGTWVTKVDWVAIEIPAPPPVVIAHGIFDIQYVMALGNWRQKCRMQNRDFMLIM